MERSCFTCIYEHYSEFDVPCFECVRSHGSVECWKPKNGIDDVEHDSVNHPFHYNKGNIEVWDFISDQGLNFDRGNAIKYICRAGTKDPDKEIQDLKKAIEYINHEIKMLKGETDNGTEKET